MALCLFMPLTGRDAAEYDVPYTPANLARVAINFSTSGDHLLVAGATGKTTKLYKVKLFVAAAMTVKFKDGPSTYVGELTFPLGVGGDVEFDLAKYAHFEGTAGFDLSINLDTAAQASGYILYLQS